LAKTNYDFNVAFRLCLGLVKIVSAALRLSSSE